MADRYKLAITTLLQEDVAVVPAANGDNNVVATNMRKLDLSACLNDFATTYVDHLHAWEHAAADIQNALDLFRSDDNTKQVLLNTALFEQIIYDKNCYNFTLSERRLIGYLSFVTQNYLLMLTS